MFFIRACEALCQCLPDQLKDDTFAECLKEDKSTKHWLTQLLKNLDNMTAGSNSQPQQAAGGGNLTGAPGAAVAAAVGSGAQLSPTSVALKLPGGI